jgi:hypothetical protein
VSIVFLWNHQRQLYDEEAIAKLRLRPRWKKRRSEEVITLLNENFPASEERWFGGNRQRLRLRRSVPSENLPQRIAMPKQRSIWFGLLEKTVKLEDWCGK